MACKTILRTASSLPETPTASESSFRIIYSPRVFKKDWREYNVAWGKPVEIIQMADLWGMMPVKIFYGDAHMERSQAVYRVIINGEQQYSVWPANRELQPGWRDTGK